MISFLMPLARQWILFRAAGMLFPALLGVFFGFPLAGNDAEPETPSFRLQKNDVVAFLGGANMARAQQAGFLEALLAVNFRDAASLPQFRDLAWEGDTVFVQSTIAARWREDKYGGWPQQLAHADANVVIAQFGKMESLAGEAGLPAFVEAYDRLIGEWRQQAKRIILVSPVAFEPTGSPLQPDLFARNADLERYVAATRQLAQRRRLPFVNLFRPSLSRVQSGLRLTANGLHIEPEQHREFARLFARAAGLVVPHWPEVELWRQAVVEKHRLWREYWRPANWKCLFGDDGERVFGRAAGIYPAFREEWRRYPALIQQAENRIRQLVAGVPPADATVVSPSLTGWSAIRQSESDPAEALSRFQLLDGLEANLFASEAEGLVNPLAMRWDSSGKLYVACTAAYPQPEPGEIPNDFIVVLTDSNGDGTADQSRIFAEGLDIPTGIETAPGGGLYVGQGTELLLLRDLDGDDQADERRLLLSGFGNGDTHQTSNSFVWSPGGELYWCQGDGIESRVETPWGISRLFQAGVFRLRPDRLQLEGLLDDFMGPGNPWGIAFDDWGQAVVIDGAGGISYLTPAMIPTLRRLRLPTIGRSGGYCGIDVASGPLLPPAIQGDFLIGDYKPNAVSRFALQRDGAGFKAVWEEPILVSSDKRFRPVDVKMGPDGAIYICDWFNTVICHQDDSYRHPDRDKAHGRIWRVAVRGTSSPKEHQPNLRQASIEQLVRNLRSQDRWKREQSKRELLRRHRQETDLGTPPPAARRPVRKALADWIRSIPESDSRRDFLHLQGLMMSATLEAVDPALLKACLAAADPRVRAYAARTTGRWHDRLSQPLTLLSAAVQDPDPQVRMEAILACGNIPRPQSVKTAAQAMSLPADAWIDYAFTQTVRHLEPEWLPALASGELDFGNRHHELLEVIRAAGARNTAETVSKLARAPDSDNPAKTIAPENRLTAKKILAVAGNNNDILWLLNPGVHDEKEHAPILNALLESNRQRPADNMLPHLSPLLNNRSSKTRQAAVRLADQWQATALYDPIRAIAVAEINALPLRIAAIESLPRIAPPAVRNALLTLLLNLAQSPAKPLALRQAAIRALAGMDAMQAAPLAVQHLLASESTRQTPALISAFLSRAEGSRALADALAASPLSPSRAKVWLQFLIAQGRSDPELTRVLREAAGNTSETSEYSREFIENLAAEIRQSGDARAGEQVFRSASANCYSCHQIAGVGGTLGPDLSAAGTGIPLHRLIEEVIWPARQVKEGYSLIQVAAKSGRLIQGYERKQRGRKNQLILEEFGTRKRISIAQKDIQSRETVGSIMPPTATSLTRSQLRDLIRFLTELGRPGEFSARDRRFIRQWEAASGDSLENASWAPVASRVAGHLDLADAQATTESGDIFWLRVPLAAAGKTEKIQFNSTRGLQFWLDQQPLTAEETTFEIPSGARELVIRVDARQRNRLGLAAKWQRH